MRCVATLACPLIVFAAIAPARAAELRISPDKRHLLKDGKPFFYLADTAWGLFLRLDRKETNVYLKDRAKKGFNVVMAILIGERPHKNEKSVYGEPPLLGRDPSRPNEKYFRHVDYVVRKANSLGMVVAIAPAWSSWMYKYVGRGPHPFNAKNARTFGAYVGRRYRRNDVIWVIGGDRDPKGYEDVLRAMAAGLDEGGGNRHVLKTFHGLRLGKTIPPRNVYYERAAAAQLFPRERWLDFSGAYSGHQWAYPIYHHIARERAVKPKRPVIDLEPCYENHPYHADGSMYHANPGKWDGKTRGTAALVRMQAYWAVLAGAAGHTYADNDVWQFFDPKRGDFEQLYHGVTPWRKALNAPGAAQMGILRRLFESRPWETLQPDQSVIAAGQGPGERHLQSGRAADGRFAFVYLPRGGKVSIAMGKLSGGKARAWWFNPRDGRAKSIGEFPCSGTRRFTAPAAGVDRDWVLVLDDAGRKFPVPGGQSLTSRKAKNDN
jgi:Protein of unknown function (DUF4038)/Putative collagen-binding domain of a collagenase